MLFFRLTGIGVGLGWNKDSFERWCYPSQLGALCYCNEASQALPGRLVTRLDDEVGTPFKCSADSWSGGVVGGDEEGTNCHNKNTHWFGEIGASWPVHLLDRKFDSLRGNKNVRYDHFEEEVFFHLNLWNTHSFHRSSHREMQKRRPGFRHRFNPPVGEKLDVGPWQCHLFRVGFLHFPWVWYYCWWKKSCTSWQVDYRIIYKVLYIPGGAAFLPSTVALIKPTVDGSEIRRTTQHVMYETPVNNGIHYLYINWCRISSINGI